MFLFNYDELLETSQDFFFAYTEHKNIIIIDGSYILRVQVPSILVEGCIVGNCVCGI